MSFKVLCLLILLNTLQTKARGRILIPINFQNNDFQKSSSSEYLDIPHGFDPQSPPTNPLLYPFVTETPTLNISITTSGWRPIVTESIMTPMLQDRLTTSMESQQDFGAIAAPPFESIVYGTWKPKRPSQPNLTQAKNILTRRIDTEVLHASQENVVSGKLGGFIDDMDIKKPITDSTDKSTNNESYINFTTKRRPFNNKIEQRKTFFSKKKSSIKSQAKNGPNIDSIEVIRVNATDPALLNVVKQINDSVEAKSKSIKIEKSKEISKEWPTDFLNSPEREQTQESSTHDSSNPSQTLDGLMISETKSSSLDINITKMGVPFENQNSDEEPSICVPLAVREPSISNPMEIVEVERVYCFPLPASEIKSDFDIIKYKNESTNDSTIIDKDAKFNVLSYKELMGSGVSSFKKWPLWILSLILLLVK